jgi:hypothetical protein
MRVDHLSLTYSSAQAGAAWAEVAVDGDPTPANGVAIAATGEPTDFVYAVLPDFSTGGSGLDGLRIQTPTRPTFLSLTMGEAELDVVPDSVTIEEDGLTVYFPSQRITAASAEPLFVRFSTTPLLYSSLFRGWLLDSRGSLPQQVAAGNATERVGTSSLIVFGSLEKPLSRFDLSTPVVTPNGDGSNDEVSVTYDLIYLIEAAEVDLTVHDLTGRQVCTVFSGAQGAGTHVESWDGRDAAGELVPPGNYLLRLSVATQSSDHEKLRALAVSY